MPSLTYVRADDGRWLTQGMLCTQCRVEIPLFSEEEPTEAGLDIIAKRVGFVCEACEVKIEAAEEAMRRTESLTARLERSELPEDLRGFFFNEMLPEMGRKFIVAQVRAWAENEAPEPRAIYLHGEAGRGKTRLAATAVYRRLHDHDCRWVSMPILLARLGAAFSDAGRRQAIAVLTGKGGLVLDDLDKTSPSEWAATQIFAAIDTRLSAGAPLLITANVRPDQLGEKFKSEIGKAIMSRCGGMAVLELPGRDNRIALPGTGTTKKEK